MTDKKSTQLGINPGTASHRLVKDLLFNFVKDVKCHRCGEALTRESFSVEHITPWLDSDDPVGLFFDLDNITYSHKVCNSLAARRTNKKYTTYKEGQRIRDRKFRANMTPERRKQRRRDQYLRTGK